MATLRCLATMAAMLLFLVTPAHAAYHETIWDTPGLLSHWSLADIDVQETFDSSWTSPYWGSWSEHPGDISVSGGRLHMVPSWWYYSGFWFDRGQPLQGSTYTIEVPVPSTPAIANAETTLGFWGANGYSLYAQVDSHNGWRGLKLGLFDENFVNVGMSAAAWNAATMKWWRVRFSMDTAYMDVSTDGVSWTPLLTRFMGTQLRNYFWPVIQTGQYGGTFTSLPAAELDNYSVVSGAMDGAYNVVGSYQGTVARGQQSIPGQASQPVSAGAGSIYVNGGRANFGDTYDFQGTSPFSVEAWVKPDSDSGTAAAIVDKSLPGGGGWRLLAQPGGRVQFIRSDSAGSDIASTPDGYELRSGYWHHLVGTYDGTGEMALYVDGRLRGTSSSGRMVPDTAADLSIGQSSSSGESFVGNVANVAVYGSKMGPADLQEHFNEGKDTGLPAVQITDGVADGSLTYDDRPSISFSSLDGDLESYECQIDTGGWQPCDGQFKPSSALSAGLHSLSVRAVDLYSNISTVQTRNFTVLPDTSIVTKPQTLSNTSQPAFSFQATAQANNFECRLNGGEWGPCPAEYSPQVPDGNNTLDVRAVSSSFTDASPVSYTWKTDTREPSVSVGNDSQNRVYRGAAPVVLFEASEDVARYECNIGGRDWQECRSPLQLVGLPVGTHDLFIRAVDLAGNMQEKPVQYLITVDPRTTSVTHEARMKLRNRRLSCAGTTWSDALGPVISDIRWRTPRSNKELNQDTVKAGNGTFVCRMIGQVQGDNPTTEYWRVGAVLDKRLITDVSLDRVKRLVSFRVNRPGLVQFRFRSSDKMVISSRRYRARAGINNVQLGKTEGSAKSVDVRLVSRISALRTTTPSINLLAY